MKPVAPTREDEVEVGGLGDTQAFTIQANAKAFRVLIDGLYSDKIRSIVRELCSNAFDAHQAVGKADVPFEVTLPTRFETVFKVRDFGTSLSHDDVMSLYTTIFGSTKEGTNAEIGKFGLGSKSPFAYTDAFTVRAIYDGVARSYSAYIGADGVPQIAAVGETPTDEAQGFEVSFAAQQNDVRAFRDAMRDVGEGFDVKPIILGIGQGIEMDWHDEEPVIAADDGSWKIFSSTPHRHRPPMARQGCVVYPIDADAVGGLSATQEGLLNAAIFLEFPIGTLDITPSRESLSYDSTTQRNILDRIQAVETSIVQKYRQLFDEQKTPWAAGRILNDITETRLPRALISVISRYATHRGRNITGYAMVSGYKLRRTGATVCYVGNHKLTHRKQMRFQPEHDLRLSINRQLAIYVENVADDGKSADKKAGERIRDHALQNGKHALWVRANLQRSSLGRLLILLGRPDCVHMVSDLPKPEAETPQKRTPVAKVKEFVNGRWVTATIDPSVGGYYVYLRNNEPLRLDGEQLGNNGFDRLLRTLRKVNHLAPGVQVYGIPQSHKNLPVKHTNWTNILERAKKCHETYFRRDQFQKYLDAHTTLESVQRMRRSDDWMTFLDELSAVVTIPEGTVAREFYDKVKQLRERRNIFENMLDFQVLKELSTGCFRDQSGQRDDDAYNLYLRSRSAYPLISWGLNARYSLPTLSRDEGEALAEYMKGVDNVRENDEKDSNTDAQAAA